MAESAARKQRGRPFQKGQSGNPAGKAKGTRHGITRALEVLLDGEGETITRKAIELAKGGDPVALRMCMDRLLPVRRDRHIPFPLPDLVTAADAVKAQAAIAAGVSGGELTPAEGAELGKVVESFANVLKAEEMQTRMEEIEAKLAALLGSKAEAFA